MHVIGKKPGGGMHLDLSIFLTTGIGWSW